MNATTYLLTQKYFALRPFSAEGTLAELADIITAGGGEITHLDDSHYGPGECYEEPAEGYEGEGWYFKERDDSPFHQASSLEDAIRQVGSHDTMEFSLKPVA